jgi:hypothetical protein
MIHDNINTLLLMLEPQLRTKFVASCWLGKDDEECSPIGGMMVAEEYERTKS